MTALTAFLAATALVACGEPDAGSGSGGSATTTTVASSGGSGGLGSGGTTTSTSTTTTVATSTSSTGGSGTGGATSDCDPAAPPGSLYALTDTGLDETEVSLCKYRGDVLLIVNTAEA